MNEQEIKRIKVSAFLDAQLPHQKPAQMAVAGVSITTVERVARSKVMWKYYKRKSRTGTSYPVAGENFLDVLVARVVVNPKTSIRQQSYKLGCSHDTVRRILREWA